MNREQKAAVIEEVATQIKESEAVFAVDYRGISVPQAADLRTRLEEADATMRVVKNTLTELAADQAGAESLKELLEGPTAFTFVRGDAALAAKVIATFRREHQVLEFKGGTMDGEVVSIDELEAISRLPSRDVLHGQLVGVLASPVTGLVRGLHQLIQGLASQLGQIADQGLVSGAAPVEEAPAAAEEAPAAEEALAGDSGNAPTEAEGPVEDGAETTETSGDQPVDEIEADAPPGDATETEGAQPAEPAASPTTENDERAQPAEPAASPEEG